MDTESVSKRYETDFVFRFTKKLQIFLWNGIQNPFHNVLKWFLYSVSKKFANFFMKRNTETVSKRYETDSVFHFIKKFANFLETDYRNRFITFWNGFCILFPIHFENFLYCVLKRRQSLQTNSVYNELKVVWRVTWIDGSTTWRGDKAVTHKTFLQRINLQSQ